MASQNYLLELLEKFTPNDKSSPQAECLPGFTSLRLVLTRKRRSPRENSLVRSTITCFEAYRRAGRSEADSIVMTARDFMVLSKKNPVALATAPRSENQSVPKQYAGATTTTTTTTASMVANQISVVKSTHPNTVGQHNFTSAPAFPENPVAAISYPERSAPMIGSSSLNNATTAAASSLASMGNSPALGSLAGPSLGTSPALNPISSQDVIAPFGLSASQLSSLLHNFSNEPTAGTKLPH